MATKKTLNEVFPQLEAIIREEYSDYEQYFPSIQEKAQYRRKQEDYWERIHRRIKEELSDGRTADE